MREELATARRRAGLTQAQVAAAAGINRSAYTNIERGVRNPSLDVALRIATVVHSDAESLFAAPSDEAAQ